MSPYWDTQTHLNLMQKWNISGEHVPHDEVLGDLDSMIEEFEQADKAKRRMARREKENREQAAE